MKVRRKNRHALRPGLEQLDKIMLLTQVPGGTPDFFGLTGTSNWANSPQPVVTLTPTGSYTVTGGIKKFQDTIAGLGATGANNLGQYLPVAVADTTTYPGSDYYEIAVIQYTQKLSSSLNPTTLRGYVQIETPVNAAVSAHFALKYPNGSPILNNLGQPVYSVAAPQFLGTEIQATSNTPVRVKFDNYLPSGVAGNLFLPVDGTVQGAGAGPNGTVEVIAADRVGTTGTTAQYTTATPQVLTVGEHINISGMLPQDYNGDFDVASVIDSTHFTVKLYEYPGGPAFRGDSSQKITLNGAPKGGTFTVTGTNPLTKVTATSAALAYNATALTVQTALNAIYGLNNVTVMGTSPTGGVSSTGTAPYTVSFGGTLRPYIVPQMTVGTNRLTGGTLPSVSIAYTTTIGSVGEAYTDNRATIHLHGGVTPWISDGTANQWISPAGQTTSYPRGVSAINVPDMPDPGPGSMTFFYTNQQSARMMFYHDHSLGITRLNVYAGEESIYTLTDAVEQNLIATGILPAATPLVFQDKTFIDPTTVMTTDPTWPIALNMGNSDLWTPHVWMPNQNPNDPTGGNNYGRWDYGPWFWPPWSVAYQAIQGAGGINITSGGTGYKLAPTVTITAAPGDTGYGASAHAVLTAGVVTSIILDTPGQGYTLPPVITITNAAGDTTGKGATATSVIWQYPDVPNISQTMEAYQDTAMVNGTPYPVMNVDPKAYRFQILNAADDRFINLQLYTSSNIVDPASLVITAGGSGYTVAPTVTIAPAAGDTTGYGATATATIDTTPGSLTFGQVIGIQFDTVGSGYTLPPVITISAPTTAGGVTATATAQIYTGGTEVGMVPAVAGAAAFPDGSVTDAYGAVNNWTTTTSGQPGDIIDGRAGGLPDPKTIGPDIIQIGNEGGFLPALNVIPSTPIGFQRNPKNITIGNVLEHGLLLAPAERADIVIDFSKFAGKTIIVYNDAPTGFPAQDSRLDYYTGDVPQQSSGGTGMTIPGYGPDTRTFMVFHVSATATPVTYNFAALQAAFTGTATTKSVFAADQPPPIVPQEAYNSAYNASFNNTASQFMNINATSIAFNPVAVTQTQVGSQVITLTGAPTGGTFTLTGVSPLTPTVTTTTAAIPSNATAAVVQAALTPIYGVGNVTVTGGNGSYTASFVGSLVTYIVPAMTLGTSTLTYAASTPAINVTNTASTQTLTLSAPPVGGTFTISGISPAAPTTPLTTGTIAFNASAAAVQTALATIYGAGNVTVTGVSPSWVITYTGTLAGVPVVPQLTVNTAGLTYTPTVIIAAGITIPATQTITLTGSPNGGTYILSGLDPRNAAPLASTAIAYNALAADVQTALNVIYGAGTVTVTGAFPSYLVTFGGALATRVVPAMTLTTNSLTYTPTVTATTTVGSQALNFTGSVAGGTFTLSGTNPATNLAVTTAALPVTAVATDIQTALAAVFGVGNVTVTGAAAPFLITFGGTLSSLNVPALTVSTTGLTNIGTVSVTQAALNSPSTDTLNIQPKAIQESFEPTYGRMMANLGVELSGTNGTTQTTISYVMQDPATEILNGISITPVTMNDGTQLWKIVHNGVDTHVVHFHLFNVQVINHVGWDGQVRNPDANEVGWKESLRMDPLSIIFVAMRAVLPQTNFGVPDSIHALDPTQPVGGMMGFTNIAPDGTPTTVMNQVVNFGDEYMWHCHVLSHEEMMMMRPINVLETKTLPAAAALIAPLTKNATGGIVLNWTDPTPAATSTGNTSNEVGFRIERAPFTNNVIGAFVSVGNAPANTTTFTDTTLTAGISYYYRVVTYNAAGDAPASNQLLYTVPNASVLGVATTSATGWYNAGKSIPIQLTFSSAVTVTGRPTLPLNNKGVATYASGSGTAVLTFNYLVAAGQDIARLDYTATGITLGTATIVGTANKVAATLTLPALTTAADALYTTNIGIDTVKPVVVAPANISSPLTSTTGSIITFPTTGTGAGSATDALSGIASAVYTPASGTVFPSGVTTVTYTATDKAGNITTTTFTVTVSYAGIIGTELVIVGTAGNDAITVNGANSGSVPVTMNGVAVVGSPFNLPNTVTNIRVSGLAGNDTITMTGSFAAILDGGTGSNNFVVSGFNPKTSATVVAQIIGSGADTVTAVGNTSYTLTNTSLTTPGQPTTITMSGVTTANLTGGTGNDVFTISGWTGKGTLTGGAGTNSVVYTGDNNFTLTNTGLTVLTGTTAVSTMTLATITVANLTGGVSANKFDVSGWTGTGTLTGGGGVDTVYDTSNSNFTVSNTSLTAGTMVMTLASVANAILIGGTGNNTFAVSGTENAILSGGAGNDTMTASGSGNVVMIGGAGLDTLSNSGTGQVIMISGTTAYDTNAIALQAILTYWASTATIAAKIAALSSTAGIAGGYKFTGGATGTVLQDPTATVNVLTDTGTGGLVWFVVKTSDRVTTKGTDTRTNLV